MAASMNILKKKLQMYSHWNLSIFTVVINPVMTEAVII